MMKKMEYRLDVNIGIGKCERCGETKMLNTHKEKLGNSWSVTICGDYCDDCIDVIDKQTDIINECIDKINEAKKVVDGETK